MFLKETISGYKKPVYSEKNSEHFQLFYFSKTLMYASVDNLPYCWLLLSRKRYVYIYIYLIEETLRLKERENGNMDEKRRIEEMQMQLKMKELELDFAREK
jgi:hypothetical protein